MGPAVRALILRDLRTSFVTQHSEHAGRVPAAIEDALRGAASPMTWLDAHLLLLLHDAIAECVGVHGTFELGRRAGRNANPLFHAMRMQAFKLLGARPESVLRWYPGGYKVAMRDAGVASFRLAQGGGAIVFLNAPSSLLGHVGYRSATAGVLVGLVESVGYACELEDASAPNVFQVRWWRSRANESTHEVVDESARIG